MTAVLVVSHFPAKTKGFGPCSGGPTRSFGGSFHIYGLIPSPTSAEPPSIQPHHFSPAEICSLMQELLALPGVCPNVSERGLAYSLADVPGGYTDHELRRLRKRVLAAVEAGLTSSSLYPKRQSRPSVAIVQTPEVKVSAKKYTGRVPVDIPA